MKSPYMRVAIAASAVVGLLLAGSATAAAAPDSSGNKGGEKPSPAASGNANGNSQGNSKGNSPGNSPGNSSNGGPGNSSANSQGNKPANPGKPAGTPGGNSQGNSSQGNAQSNSQGNSANSGTKTLPDTASPVAQAAVNKDKTATPVSPTIVSPVEDIAEPVAPAPESPAENTATPPAASPQSNRDSAAAGPASPARPATNPTPGAPPAVDGADSLGAPATAAWAVPLSPSGATPDAGDSVAAGVGKWLGDAATTIAREVREALREVTLKDLALAALPGVAGLLFFLATGVGLGHRQARFSFALETSGARLAPRGPLGLVGSGSLVRMRSTTPTRRRTLRLVDRAA